MQDRNDMLDILNTKVGKLDDLLKEPMPAKATSRTIAILPNQGEVIQLRGLDFVVRYVNKRTGKLHLEIRADELRNEAVDAGQGMASHTEDVVKSNGTE